MNAKRAEKAIPFAEQPPHVQEAAAYKMRLAYQRAHIISFIVAVAIAAIPAALALGLAVWLFRWAAGL